MIGVTPAPEPKTFDARVRQPGGIAIAELVGERPVKRKGRYRAIATRREDLKGSDFPPLWRLAADDLLAGYGRICAYACIYIPHLVGSATTDHFAPKSQRWDRVYEWSNYRLACALLNGLKGDFADVMDPFDVQAGMFALDLTLKPIVVPGPSATPATLPLIQATIDRLRLDGNDYREAVNHYYELYSTGEMPMALVERWAPFLAAEMRRQGKLQNGDV